MEVIIYVKFGILYFLNRVLYRLVGIFKMGDIDEWFISPARGDSKERVVFPPQPAQWCSESKLPVSQV